MVGGRKADHEESASERGYDAKWTRLSVAQRRKHPFCRFCEQEGRETVIAEDVDHIIPLEDGGARLDPANLQSLCKRHHYGLKARLQDYARRMGLIEQLPDWCADPTMRPDLTKRG